MAKKTFVQGALILTIAGVLGKILSAGYRIPFVRIVGKEASAIYGMSYSIYAIIFALSTAGIPLAVSKLVAVTEEKAQHGESVRILRVSFILLALIGVVASVAFFLAAPWIAEVYFKEPRAMLSLRCLAPAMLFSCLMAVFRGFFQGRQDMVPTAISQILEQFFRVGTILLSLFVLMGESIPVVVAGASFGSMVGGLAGFLFLLIVFLRFVRVHRPVNLIAPSAEEQMSDRDLVRQLFYYAIPISIGALLLPITQFIDSTLVVRRLEALNLTHSMALEQLAYIGTAAMPIINLPFIITTAIAASLVPAIADAWVMKDKAAVNKNVRAAMIIAVVLTLPASAGLAQLGTPIMKLLYNQPEAGGVLSALAFMVLVVGIYQVTSGALQGLGKVVIPMVSLGIGVLGKCYLTWVLPGIAGLEVRGAALGTVIAFSIAALHNVFHLIRLVGSDWFDLKQTILKPLFATIVMVLLVWAIMRVFAMVTPSVSLAAIASISAGGIGYFVALFMVGGIDTDALTKIPKIGPKLARKFSDE